VVGDGRLLRGEVPVSALFRRWRSDPLRWTLVTIAAGTTLSGAVQMVAPGFVLDLLSAPSSTATRLFFGIVGMFMTIIGAVLLHALLEPYDRRIVVFWAAMQKLAAAGAVALCVAKNVFSNYGLLLSAFDFATGALGLGYLWRIRR
jgi:hypothetical protein